MDATAEDASESPEPSETVDVAAVSPEEGSGETVEEEPVAPDTKTNEEE